MEQNFSKNENEPQLNRQTVTVKDYLGYSSADVPVLQVNDLVKPTDLDNDSLVVNISENKSPFIMVTSTIANRIDDELAKFWKSKKTIRSLTLEVNKYNVFNFVKNMLTISNSRSVLGDISKYITYKELKHIVYSMLVAADELGFSDSSKYKMLLKEYNIISKVCSQNPNKGIDKKTLNAVNLRLESLFEYMSRTQH